MKKRIYIIAFHTLEHEFHGYYIDDEQEPCVRACWAAQYESVQAAGIDFEYILKQWPLDGILPYITVL